VEWGGDTEFVEVSALTSQGIDTLLETLSLTSEILDLKANPARPALGVVLEAESSPGRGVVATVLVRDGTLRLGDCVLCGSGYGRVRGLWRNGVERVTEAGPSSPVAVTGLDVVPLAGEKLYVLKDLEQARSIAEDRRQKRKGPKPPPLDPWSTSVPEVRVILKADVQGTLEALKSSLSQLGTEEVKLKLLHAQVGGVNHADIMLADAFRATVFGFNVGADEQARSLAEERGIEIRRYDIIYRLIDDARALLQGQLAPQLQEEVHGHAEIRQLYKASKVGTIAGCMVTDGFIARSDQVRLQREGRVVHTGTLHSLKRFKDDAREVKSGFDCGLKIADYEDIKVGDVVEAFAMVEKPRQL
jgi:translation initiation factor IF-2